MSRTTAYVYTRPSEEGGLDVLIVPQKKGDLIVSFFQHNHSLKEPPTCLEDKFTKDELVGLKARRTTIFISFP
jgi:hypothetical protein